MNNVIQNYKKNEIDENNNYAIILNKFVFQKVQKLNLQKIGSTQLFYGDDEDKF